MEYIKGIIALCGGGLAALGFFFQIKENYEKGYWCWLGSAACWALSYLLK